MQNVKATADIVRNCQQRRTIANLGLNKLCVNISEIKVIPFITSRHYFTSNELI